MNKLILKYQYISKNLFVDSLDWADVSEDKKQFLKSIRNWEPYLVEFDNESQMLLKLNVINDEIKSEKYHQVIIITQSEFKFFSNDSFWFR